MGKPVIPIALGLVFAAIAAFMTLNYLRGATSVPEVAEFETRNVVVATKVVPRGALVTREHVKLVEWPLNSAPEGSFENLEDAIGKIVRAAIYANDPVTEQKLLDSKSRSVLSALIPTGRRAMTIRVNEVTGIAGFVAPGSRVDVVLSIPGSEDEPARTRTVLQDVEVLAIAQTVEQLDSEPVVVNTVTLNVSPREGESLSLSANQGALQLSLRNDKDQAKVYTAGVSIDQVIGKQGASTGGPEVEVIRGLAREITTF